MIQNLSPNCTWRQVRSQDNPADLISRGTPSVLNNHPLWWHGPSWLTQDIQSWPKDLTRSDSSFVEENCEVRCLVVIAPPLEQDLVIKFSSFMKTIRVVAYCKRFIFNATNSTAKHVVPLTALELKKLSSHV